MRWRVHTSTRAEAVLLCAVCACDAVLLVQGVAAAAAEAAYDDADDGLAFKRINTLIDGDPEISTLVKDLRKTISHRYESLSHKKQLEQLAHGKGRQQRSPPKHGKLLNADGTEAKGKEKSRLVKLLKRIFPLFHPDSPFRTFWNLFIMLLIFYCAFVRTRATAQSLLNLSLTPRCRVAALANLWLTIPLKLPLCLLST